MDLKTICEKGTPHAEKKRVGRGIGSGSGKTCGRGHKGWGARSGAPRRPGYEGGQMPIYRRVPKRGFTNAVFRKEYTVINVDRLNDFDNGATVDLAAVLEHGLVSMNTPLLKVLGQGELERKLTEEDMLICSGAEPVAIAGVMGGEGSKVAAETHDLLLEVASFHATTVRRTSARLGLRTDASARFEKSLDPTLPSVAAAHLVNTLRSIQPDITLPRPLGEAG